jgi:hypothetical protein
MKLHVLPGQYLMLHEELMGVERSTPRAVLVQQVNRGTLIVPEIESANGLARIVIHSQSKEKGTFWYEFTRVSRHYPKDGIDLNYEGCSCNILKLEDAQGNQIRLASFIED